MILQHRPMRPTDVDQCVDIVAEHPVLGPRYGESIAQLGPAWLRLLGCDAMPTRVIEAEEAGQRRICFVGVSLCVSDDVSREVKTPPLRWIGPELARRIMAGESLALTDKQVREHNSRDGLNGVVWEGVISTSFETRSDTRNEIYREVMRAFLDGHQGFRWKELIGGQAESVERFQRTVSTGAFWWNPETGQYVNASGQDHERIVSAPHIIGVTRALDIRSLGSWVSHLFDYYPPRCGFSRAEQHLLLLALDGVTDEELSIALGISVSTVKKSWISIYGRAVVRLPHLIADSTSTSSTSRGKEKRRRLLGYIRNHPEELRPFSANDSGALPERAY